MQKQAPRGTMNHRRYDQGSSRPAPVSARAQARKVSASGAVRGRVTIVKQVEIIEARSSPCSLFLGGQDVWQCASGYFAERRRSTSDINGLCDLVSGGASAADLALPITPRHSARRQPGERT